MRIPRKGIVIQGTGGLRKVRITLPGHGRRGGGRLLYLYVEVRSVIYLIAVFRKSEQADLTRDDYRAFAALVEHLKRERTP